jgi:signal transduction histidine kinase
VARWLAVASAALALGIAAAVVATWVMLEPPRADLIDMALYLFISGAVSLSLGVAIVIVLERRVRLSLVARSAIVPLVTAGVFVGNILVLAQMMFISTDHDLQVVLAVTAFGVIVSSVFASWAASMTSGRIVRVTEALRTLAAGGRSVSLDVDGHDEIATLAGDVDALARRLRDADDERAALDAERRELTAAISHDLRTPLSTIRAMIDALEDDVVSDPVEVTRYFVTMRRDVERLNRMIDDLFELAQIDSGALKLRRERIAIHEIVAEVVDAMRARADRAGVHLRLSIASSGPPALLDGDRIERAISNLLRNALEHTPAGGEIHVQVTADEAEWSVDVADTGEGIDERDIESIWTRFYRAERSRSRTNDSSEGAGLGLAITKGIVELHGGSVAVRSRRGEGAAFTIVLPVTAPADER